MPHLQEIQPASQLSPITGSKATQTNCTEFQLTFQFHPSFPSYTCTLTTLQASATFTFCDAQQHSLSNPALKFSCLPACFLSFFFSFFFKFLELTWAHQFWEASITHTASELNTFFLVSSFRLQRITSHGNKAPTAFIKTSLLRWESTKRGIINREQFVRRDFKDTWNNEESWHWKNNQDQNM